LREPGAASEGQRQGQIEAEVAQERGGLTREHQAVLQRGRAEHCASHRRDALRGQVISRLREDHRKLQRQFHAVGEAVRNAEVAAQAAADDGAPAHVAPEEEQRVTLVLGGQGETELPLRQGIAGAQQERVLASWAERHLHEIEGLDGRRLRQHRRASERTT
jgi:hypothetical protein